MRWPAERSDAKAAGKSSPSRRRRPVHDTPPDLSALAAIESTGIPLPDPPRPATRRLFISNGSPRGAEPIRPAQQRLRPRPLGPKDLRIHRWLPVGLILFGYVLPTVGSLIRSVQSPQPFWDVVLDLAGVLLLVAVVLPCTLLGLKIASRIMHFELVDGAGYLGLAVYAAPTVVMSQIVRLQGPPQPGSSLSDILSSFAVAAVEGELLGLVISFFLLWLFFRLDFPNSVVAWVSSGLLNFVGSALATAALMTAAIYLGRMLALSKTPNSAPVITDQTSTPDSPQGVGLAQPEAMARATGADACGTFATR